jgi:hypothetical protein
MNPITTKVKRCYTTSLGAHAAARTSGSRLRASRFYFQMRQAGVAITSGVAAFTGMLRDNPSPLASEYYAALDLPATRYVLQITQANNDASKQRGGMKGAMKGVRI